MIRLRSACAWTLLAVFAFGGTAAPAVHRAVHGLENEAAWAVHTADGHHTADSAGHHARESCPTTAARDLACALCAGVAASVVDRADRPFVALVEGERVAPEPLRLVGRSEAEPSSRGPPAGVA